MDVGQLLQQALNALIAGITGTEVGHAFLLGASAVTLVWAFSWAMGRWIDSDSSRRGGAHGSHRRGVPTDRWR